MSRILVRFHQHHARDAACKYFMYPETTYRKKRDHMIYIIKIYVRRLDM